MKYPNKINKKSNIKNFHYEASFKNKGDNLEYDLNISNHYYLQNNIANIHKKPTPIKVVDISNSYEKSIITKAFFQTSSTTDYNGIYKGKYIDFEAKETTSNTSFALSNIHIHQVEHLKSVKYHGGIAFILILFIGLNKLYLLPIENYIYFIENYERKSIPIKFFEEYSTLVEFNYHPRVDYLKAVDEVYFGGFKNEKK